MRNQIVAAEVNIQRHQAVQQDNTYDVPPSAGLKRGKLLRLREAYSSINIHHVLLN